MKNRNKSKLDQLNTHVNPQCLSAGNGVGKQDTLVTPQCLYAGYSVIKQRGFTLIELLVVVLIIGILAAVAVPQYKSAVDKSRVMNLVTMAKSIVAAEEVYYLANGSYTKDMAALALSLPLSGGGISVGFSLVTGYDGSVNGVSVRDAKLPGVKVMGYYDNNPSPELFHGLLCGASHANAHAVKVCKHATKDNYAYGTGPLDDPHDVYRFN